jgi:signal transduction histidine kinase/CheY-like chemotaxis protein
MFLAWGPQLSFLYNDGYAPIFGAKHPGALARPFRELWPEIWADISPLVERALAGEPTWSENLLLFMERNGYPEEVYFTFSYSPIWDESGGIGGMFCACTETTATVLSERRLRTLNELSAAAAAAQARTEAETEASCLLSLESNRADIPFALLWRLADGEPRLAGRAGTWPAGADEDALEPEQWQLVEAARGEAVVIESLAQRSDLPRSPWGDPIGSAVALPVPPRQVGVATAALVIGINPRRVLDEAYRTFLERIAAAFATAMANARAFAAERRRAEALAEIDRAKTEFFSNVSHEFRTPLTLMLGPLQDTLARSQGLPPTDRAQLETVHRNSLRLLKLVNTLLDFSRIEAGRVQAVYEPTDLASLTRELAGVFRAAVENAGLTLTVDCPPLAEPVYVDREMWEKIVLNLVSNAFKFTFEGGIEVSLGTGAGQATLVVRDTGTGIPAEEMPRLFERFHRVGGAQGRTHEGSGIGLALVQELVRLHGGAVTVDSAVGRGSTFTVMIPLGRGHLPAERIGTARTHASTALGAAPFVEEALRWLPGSAAAESVIRDIEVAVPAREDPQERARIVFADDNADMRDYVRRLLAPRYEVETVEDGEAALDAVGRHKPDLVLSDVMMPRLDGIGLLARLRADPETGTLPVILLSARAGEESRVEGMQAGADDYLIKPFSARELIARIEAHVRMARIRREAARSIEASEERFRAFVTTSFDVVYRMSPDWREMRHLRGKDFIPDTEGPRTGWLATYIHPDDQAQVMAAIEDAIRAKSVFELEHRVIRVDGTLGWTHSRAVPMLGGDGEIVEWFGAARDITDRKQAEETQILLVNELNHRVKNTLASVQAIVQHTLRSARNPAEFVESFGGRIQSLARVHALLTTTTWRGADLRDLIRDQLLQGAVDETRIAAWGPSVHLEAQMALHLALVLHELGTNAQKHGALSVPSGSITIDWTVEDEALRLRWQERGSPPPSAPTRRGFGTTLIQQSMKGAGGGAGMSVGHDGINWRITMPLPAASVAAGPRTADLIGGPCAASGVPADTAAPGRLARGRLLVIEDEPLVALDITGILTDAGAALVNAVGSAREALEIIESKSWDAALLDGNLHGQPVDEIAAALTRRRIPFVFITGYGREGLPQGFRSAVVLSKPFRPQQLIEAAASLLGRRCDVVQLRERE